MLVTETKDIVEMAREVGVRHLKLQQPDRPRIRVRDLARELDMADVELLSWLRENGEWTKSVLTFLEEPVASRVRAHFGAPIVPSVTTSEGAVGQAPPAAKPLRGLGPPATQPARQNNPYLGQLGAARSRPPAVRRQDLDRPVEAWTNDNPALDYTAAGSPRASRTMAPFEWAIRGVEADKELWLEHGLGEQDARLAAACQDAGLRPEDLRLGLSGWTVLERITRGEPPLEVVRLLGRERAGERDSG